MNVRSDDEFIHTYLRETRHELPERAYAAVRREIDKTPQRIVLGPWRTPFMNNLMRYAAAAVAVVAISVTTVFAVNAFSQRSSPVGPSALPATPRPSPLAVVAATPVPQVTAAATSQSITPAPDATVGRLAPFPLLDATYTSPSYGYTIGYPQGWTVQDGSGTWPAHVTLGVGNPRLDVIRGPIGFTQARFSGASQRVTPAMTALEFLQYQGQTIEDWGCTVIEPLPEHVRIASTNSAYAGGVAAFVDLDGCQSNAGLGGLIWDMAVVTPDGRGYNFTFDGQLKPDDVMEWVSTIHLDPATATDSGPATHTP